MGICLLINLLHKLKQEFNSCTPHCLVCKFGSSVIFSLLEMIGNLLPFVSVLNILEYKKLSSSKLLLLHNFYQAQN